MCGCVSWISQNTWTINTVITDKTTSFSSLSSSKSTITMYNRFTDAMELLVQLIVLMYLHALNYNRKTHFLINFKLRMSPLSSSSSSLLFVSVSVYRLRHHCCDLMHMFSVSVILWALSVYIFFLPFSEC